MNFHRYFGKNLFLLTPDFSLFFSPVNLKSFSLTHIEISQIPSYEYNLFRKSYIMLARNFGFDVKEYDLDNFKNFLLLKSE